MKKSTYFLAFLVSTFFFLPSAYSELKSELKSAGVVNFQACVLESKYGKREQEFLKDAGNKQIAIMKDLQKQIQSIATKLEDAEYIDGLSPEAEEGLRSKYRSQNEELMRYQRQYHENMSQANFQLTEAVRLCVNQASESVAKKQNLSMVIQKDSFFYHEPAQDITAEVICEMDKNFDKENKPEDDAAENEGTPKRNVN